MVLCKKIRSSNEEKYTQNSNVKNGKGERELMRYILNCNMKQQKTKTFGISDD